MLESDQIFSNPTVAWFDDAFAGPTRVQTSGWPVIASGGHTLLLAPTGSGKTLAAFLWALDRLRRLPPDAPPGIRVVYVSPLKALVYDVERNLRAPLAGLTRTAERLGETARGITVGVRTGDTSQRDRQRMLKHPPDVLVTTPESLYLMLGSRVREHFRATEAVIIDEIHAIAGTKRGAHLALTLERLSALAESEPQRVGLSATVAPVGEVARFLGGQREVAIVDTSEPPRLELVVTMPQPGDAAAVDGPASASTDSDAFGFEGPGGSILGAVAREKQGGAERGIWPAIETRIYELIMAHRTTIVFVNNRSATERLTHQLNERAQEMAGDETIREIALAHHGSLSRKRREQVEDMLKSGAVKSIIATSSLELGIDMGTVDLVVQIESPGAVSRGLQRVGRAGHGVGEISKGIVFPKYRGDLLECAVTARGMLDGALEPVRVQRNALDVLAQQIVAMCTVDERSVDSVFELIRRAYGYAELGREVFHGVLDMLSGRYPSTEFADLRPRLVWDRTGDVLRPRKGARLLAMTNAGTIPDRGLYRVHIGEDGPRIGELDEEMVYEARPGQTFILGASTWRIDDITADRVIVSPAPGEPGQLPFWRGAGPGRPIALGRAMGALLAELEQRSDGGADTLLADRYPLDGLARSELIEYVREQQQATGHLPTDKTFLVERFVDEIGDVRVCIHSLYGSAVNAPWAMAIEAQLARESGFEVNVLWSDDGISVRFTEDPDSVEAIDLDRWVPDPDELEDLLMEQLAHTALFAAEFRESASRALLLPRRAPGKRTPLWAQRQKSQRLLAVARQYPAFPIVLESYRACMQHVFDLDALRELLRALRRRELRMIDVQTDRASPFARSLVFDYVAAWLYEGDAPLAERRAQALTLDRNMLRELLGHAELRDLLDPGALAEVEAELQGLTGAWRAHSADELHDLLRRVGGLTEAEVRARSAEPPDAWLQSLVADARIARMRIAGEERYVAAEDAGLFRDALGAMPPQGLPMALLGHTEAPLRQLVVRFARTHGPFTTAECARRWGLRAEQVLPLLQALHTADQLVLGELRPGGVGREWCDNEVLRRIRRRSIAAVRGTTAPVAAEALGRFLPAWHGVGENVRVEAALHRLEGVPVAFSELESRILPQRVGRYDPQQLDLLTATGQWVWVGDSALGVKDGRVRLYQRERVGLLHTLDESYEPPSAVHAAVLAYLERRGACFLFELSAALKEFDAAEAMSALWDLVWAGQVTNDTVQPLRQLGARGSRSRSSRSRRGVSRSAGGRWSRVSDLLYERPTPTEREHARALTLIERHGVLARDSMGIEDVRGGFSAIYPVLRALEENGRIRRGYFVEGLSGVQFAAPGAVDQLRSVRDDPRKPEIQVLAAADPANPWGAALGWPESPSGQGGKREVGASVVLVGGLVWAHLSRSGRVLTTFEPMADSRYDDDLRVEALARLAAAHPRRPIQIERVDGESVGRCEHQPLLLRAGFEHDYKGLRWVQGVR